MGKYWKAIIAMTVIVPVLCCSSRQSYIRPPIDPTITRADATNINTASIEELERLPHIGRKIAENVVLFREENGPFRRVEHIMQIRGISESRFLEFRPYLRTE